MPSSSQPTSPARGRSRCSDTTSDVPANDRLDRRLFLNNEEAARFLNLSPRTLEKHRVIGDGPRFRKLGRRIVYAIGDLEGWADARACESTSDPQYAAKR
jgi:hypothetical protein